MNNETINKQIHMVYGRVVILAFFCHILFMTMFVILHIPQMAVYNLASCLFYVVMFWISKKGYFRILVSLIHAEISLFAIVSTCILGWDLGYSFYLIALSTQVYFCPFKRKYIPYLFSLAEIFAFLLLKIYTLYHTPAIACGERMTTGFYLFNSLVSFSMILYTAFLSRVSSTIVEENNSQLQDMVNYDALTHLWTRVHLNDFFGKTSEISTSMIVVMTDIDDFKSINDTYGHNCGDYVLCHLASIIHSMCPENSGVCRWGGEEFVLMFPDYEMADVFLLVEKIREKIASYAIDYQGHKLRVTMTFGISSAEESSDLQELIRLADKRLYYGKRNGKNIVVSPDLCR